MENLSLFLPEELPETDTPKRKSKDFTNALAEQLKRIMALKGTTISDIHKATRVPYSTLSEWVGGKNETQRLDDNIKKLARFFGVSVDFLTFAIPLTDEDLLVENAIGEMEDFLEDKCS